MGKFHITLKTDFGEIAIDGDSREEILSLLKDALSLIEDVKNLSPREPTTRTAPLILKKKLVGIIEVTANGRPQVTIPPENLTAKDIIGLLLYWKYPSGLSLNELTQLISLSWNAMNQSTVSARLTEMKGLVIKEGQKGKYIYKLSGAGKSWVETNILPQLKSEKK